MRALESDGPEFKLHGNQVITKRAWKRHPASPVSDSPFTQLDNSHL